MSDNFMDGTQLLLQQTLDAYYQNEAQNLIGGRFFHLTEKNSEVKDSAFANFDMKKPSAGSATNITEHVTVPTSEHVAEIVGRQGCKIKALRNKTNTYIKTPGRGEAPLFTITGQKNDVELAVHEIKQASHHFTNIRAQRTKGISPPNIEGSITDRVQVPYRVVGLVVGPKGQTIKQIQAKTDTFIVTPSRERDPIFEITGRPEDVAKAREEIVNYICIRTGMTLEENNMGHFSFNSDDQQNLDSVLSGHLFKGELRARELPSFPFYQFSTEKIRTGEWNPIKQEIDEFHQDSNRGVQLIRTYPGKHETDEFNQNSNRGVQEVQKYPGKQDEFHQTSNRGVQEVQKYPGKQDEFHQTSNRGVQGIQKYPGDQFLPTFPGAPSYTKIHLSPPKIHQSQGLQGSSSLLSHDIRAQGGKVGIGATGGKQMKLLTGNEMPFGLENQENCDPLKAVTKKHVAQTGLTPRASIMGSASPLRGLNVQTFDPFCWGNSSLIRTHSNSPVSPPNLDSVAGDILGLTDSGDEDFNSVRDTFQDLQLGSAFNPSDAAKISPLSNGSQHSSTESYSSVPSHPINDVMACFGGSLLGQWNPSPVRDIRTSIASSCNNTLTTEYSLAGTNIPDCWVLSPPKLQAPKSPTRENSGTQKCHVCQERAINAALVPCGHNHFCYECASACVGKSCPSCASEPSCALRILK